MRCALLLSFFLFGCTLNNEILRVPAEGARSLLFVEVLDGAPPSLVAFDRDETSSFYTFPIPEKEPVDLFALHFDCPLDRLGLSASARIAQPGEMGRPFPLPARAVA